MCLCEKRKPFALATEKIRMETGSTAHFEQIKIEHNFSKFHLLFSNELIGKKIPVSDGNRILLISFIAGYFSTMNLI